jgi:ribosome-binding protein aMBF1 (putative translation factor)
VGLHLLDRLEPVAGVGWRLEAPKARHLAYHDAMPPRSKLVTAPPYAVEAAIKQLGAHLRIARVRRNLSLADMANKLGVDRHVIADAERGKITTSIAVYVGLLWGLNLLERLEPVAHPALDEEGLTLQMSEARDRAYPRRTMSNDF